MQATSKFSASMGGRSEGTLPSAAGGRAHPHFEAVVTWLEHSLPPERGAAVIHNDYRFDNVVLDPSDPMKIIGVLDGEMARILPVLPRADER